jgi:hypothetical protein
VKIELASHAVATLFPRTSTPPELNFFTEIAGHLELDAKRTRALASLTMQGRVVEIDLKSGDILWEYEHTLDVTPYMQLSGQGTDKRYARFGSGAY